MMDTSVVKRVVYIVSNEDGFTLIRNGEPYFIKGVGGSKNLKQAKEAGANSLRTWSAKGMDALFEEAKNLDMTVMLGIHMSKHASDYLDDEYKRNKLLEVKQMVEAWKHHPSLLVYGIGNEINLGTTSDEAWQFVEEIASLIKRMDPNHPVGTVLAGAPIDVLNKLASITRSLDFIGINAYADFLPHVRSHCERSDYHGPVIITEYGPRGHWEVRKTAWGAPIEQNSTEKAESYLSEVQLIEKNRDFYLGSYVFVWGQKQERTPTWYGLFLEHEETLGLSGEATSAVDAMELGWTGKLPATLAPSLRRLTLDGKHASEDILLKPGVLYTARVESLEHGLGSYHYVWEILKEATELGFGGSYEPRPERVLVLKTNQTPQTQFSINHIGNYRLFVYHLSENGKAAYANIPFRIDTM